MVLEALFILQCGRMAMVKWGKRGLGCNKMAFFVLEQIGEVVLTIRKKQA
jgi:hypothetical protein